MSRYANGYSPLYSPVRYPAITTVGYGEITPRSFLGRLVTLPLLVFGLLLIALPTFVLGREFSLVWDMMKENQVRLSELTTRERPLSFFSNHQVTTEEDYIPASPHLQRIRGAPSVLSVDRIPEDLRLPHSISRRRRSSLEQAELSSQISELRATVEMQSEMIRRIVDNLEGKGKQRMDGGGESTWS